MGLAKPVWHPVVAGSVAVLRDQMFDAVGISTVEGHAMGLVARADVDGPIKCYAVPCQRAFIRARQEIVCSAGEARRRRGGRRRFQRQVGTLDRAGHRPQQATRQQQRGKPHLSDLAHPIPTAAKMTRNGLRFFAVLNTRITPPTPAVSRSYLVIMRYGGVDGVGAAGEIANTDHPNLCYPNRCPTVISSPSGSWRVESLPRARWQMSAMCSTRRADPRRQI